MLINDAFEQFKRSEVVAKGLSKKTLASYENTQSLFCAYFGGDSNIEDITLNDILSFNEHLSTWQRSDTVRNNLFQVRAVFKFCILRKMDVLEPDLISVPKKEKRMIQYLTEQEYEEFLSIVATKRRGYSDLNRLRNMAIIETLYATGLRVSELCRLNRNSIKNRQFTVIGKSKEPRICFISTRAERAIAEYLAARTDTNQALFIANQTGRRMTTYNVRTVFRTACANSDFDNIHPHTIRHSYATKLLDKGVDIRYIADLLGHQSLDTTKQYTHYANPKLKKIYDLAMEN